MEGKKINFGIRKDLNTDIRYEPNACKGYVLDISLGCPHRCIYCLFAPLENRAYRLMNPSYKDDVLPLNLDNLMKRTEFPPAVYMCYSSDPLGNDELKKLTIQALNKLYENNVSVLFITKGIFSDDVIETIKKRPDLMNIQVDTSSADDERNLKVEPGAPTYEQRLENLRKLSKIDGIASLGIRMDPLLPNMDDTVENVTKIMKDMKEIGIHEAVTGYVLLTRNMRNSWMKNKYFACVAEAMTEKTPTISGEELFSIPYEEKVNRLRMIREICSQYDVKMSVCGCKEERFKTTDFEWVCHPYNRKRREEFMEKSDCMPCEYDHL